MPSERVQRRIDDLLDQAEQAVSARDWNAVLEIVAGVLHVDPENEDALSLKGMAEASLSQTDQQSPANSQTQSTQPSTAESDQPTSFASGRYTVSKFLGEGGKKKVYLAHDNTLDRDVAFALIKTEGLDETSRERVKREAQAMGRMGTHPSIMPIYDLGEENGQPFMVQPLMSGGDVEGLVEDAEGPLELDRALEIATQTAQGLSFAHSKGIVHRDLKPGNVWLDEDGAAKIGDFGLAVATDRSRLTVEKVMVGTVSYMPPEQATGGEVTPRADLYSSGAMLYEMCTGRVPFMADDDIGVISQHINTPPVAPSWHNNQIPKILDSLILRLLAKDPAERPTSADEVLAALKSVDLTSVEEREEGSKGSLDAMAGGVFVGRHREMDQLKSIFEDVLSGKGRMVTLVGEPGIGKTRTAQELATYAGMRGAEVLWGRSYESGGAPPYWPWVQAIRSHVASTEPQALRDQLGSTAPVIADVVSDVKAKLPDLPVPIPIEDPESARFRLFDSISTFLKNIAGNQPLVVMLEDLHWSDKPSLMLLEFVARELANSRILIVGNYRDMELNRRHPLSVTLGDLSRERLFERVVLRGLQRHDVQRFIEIAAGIAPPPALVDAVHSQTEGNPLFVTETVRLLIQEGDITSGQSSKGGTTSWEIRIPEGVREVIGRRLDRLSERCNELLTIAAVIGRQFRFDVLKMLAEDTTDNQLLDAMDEALSGRIIEELPEEVGLYQFTHAQMQETLRGELSATRTVRMHAQIAEALEKHYGNEAEEHAAELAEHFTEATLILGTRRAIEYLTAAAEKSFENLSFEEARTKFERASQLIEDSKDLRTMARISEGLAYSLYTTGSSRLEYWPCLHKAFNLYVEVGDVASAVRIGRYPIAAYQTQEQLELYQHALALAEPNSEDAGWILTKISYTLGTLNSFDAAIGPGMQAFEIAVRIDDPKLAAWSLGRLQGPAFESGELTSVLKFAEQANDFLNRSNDADVETHINYHAGLANLALGDSDRAKELAELAENAATRARASRRKQSAYHVQLSLAIAVGDWERGRCYAKLLAEVSKFTKVPAQCMLLIIESSVGNWSDVEKILPEILAQADRVITAQAYDHYSWGIPVAAGLLNAGSNMRSEEYVHKGQEVLAALQKNPSQRPFLNSYIKRFSIAADLIYGNSTDSERLEFDKHVVLEFVDAGNGSASAPMMAQGRLAGLQALVEKDFESASIYFSRSLEQCRSSGYLPELARSCVDHSDLLLDRNAPGDREKAIELQDEAIAIATELGMKPLLERVLAKREILKA